MNSELGSSQSPKHSVSLCWAPDTRSLLSPSLIWSLIVCKGQEIKGERAVTTLGLRQPEPGCQNNQPIRQHKPEAKGEKQTRTDSSGQRGETKPVSNVLGDRVLGAGSKSPVGHWVTEQRRALASDSSLSTCEKALGLSFPNGYGDGQTDGTVSGKA